MIVLLEPNGGLGLLDPLDFKHLSLRVRRGEALADSPAVLFDQDQYGWISEQALRAWPGPENTPVWQEALTRMLEFARSRGWFDDERARLRAHIEWTGPE